MIGFSYHRKDTVELRQLRYFLAVAEELHFRRAAERLHLAQPSLSLQIQNLEEELGVKLFERSNRGVRLTIAGEKFLKETRQILLSVNKAVQGTKETADGMAGALSISLVSTALVGLLPSVLRSFIAQTPGVDIELEELDPEDQIHYLLRGRADIGFIHGVVSEPQLATFVVESDQLIVAVPAKLASRKKSIWRLFLNTRPYFRRHSPVSVSASMCARRTNWPAQVREKACM